ncbi:hypothetical protein TREMEDRAFT_66036 [Tremella mesenterica DSM 1558]|uniref:uncharacterized protein n=1 Tax=Tremella mesenterica (strain ATCC 24925 / CBS 8224 / DSM 1558 / NBRC 9311 / NRRL Y-6157 / RJB 2259-6 / UBC 559-6) TaxID=578456 RepID=UPI00032C4664|nr:uncharacterized protein TREMEDRAFT_66036 [Tremella mesenterica DSM 1558]EIW65947.1 hypothetical protein TREMEDRAFT_66036 [Tremella mesenterica DSM 1558]
MGLTAITPIGFAASREMRRGDGEGPIPSPVVMGFDFKSIDEEQLRTVRNTLSIKQQQEALIAQRQRETAAANGTSMSGNLNNTPAPPRELTFKDWHPKSEKPSVGKRREKTRDKVERMSIVTNSGDNVVYPASKSAPLNNHPLSAQQNPPREQQPSGSQTAIPPHILPSLNPYSPEDTRMGSRSGYPSIQSNHSNHPNHSTLANHPNQISHTSHSNHATHTNHLNKVSQSNQINQAGSSTQPIRLPPTPIQDQDQEEDHLRHNTSSQYYRHLPHLSYGENRIPHNTSQSQIHRPSNSTNSISMSVSPGRNEFLEPFVRLYEALNQTEHLKHTLMELNKRFETSFKTQVKAATDIQGTAEQANGLLKSLQASAENLQTMVRYEVERAESLDKKELRDLKERLKRLEDRLGG